MPYIFTGFLSFIHFTQGYLLKSVTKQMFSHNYIKLFIILECASSGTFSIMIISYNFGQKYGFLWLVMYNH